jgi:hypothetical protein
MARMAADFTGFYRVGPCLALIFGAACSGVALADELPRSPACRTAVQALDRAETAITDTAAAASAPADAARQRSVAMRLQPLREQVGRACLGGLTTSPSPSQHTYLAPAPARVTAAPRSPMPTVPPVSVPMPRVEVPITLSNCNAATCLGSDGSTLTRVGPNVVGPRGACTVQGVFVRCP